MKQMAILREKFEAKWNCLADADDCYNAGDLWHKWFSRFEWLLIDTFRDVFEEAKKNLEPKPPEFAYRTVRDWCFAADDRLGRILIEVENHQEDWEDLLHELQLGVVSEIPLADMVYKPQSALCLETVVGLPPRSRELRKVLSQIHPYLTKAMKNILAQEGCASLQDAIKNFPVLRGLKENELQRFRGSANVTENKAAKELLNSRLRTVIGEDTVDRYFRPKQFSPR